MRVTNSGSAQTNMETTDSSPEAVTDRGVADRTSRPNNREEGSSVQQTDAPNITLDDNSNNDRPPPVYPCQDVCIQCGKKVPETDDNPEVTITQQTPEPITSCPCECHMQMHSEKVTEVADQLSQGHIPPAGPRCLPGCGYSGLPCYNCSLLQAHLQPQDSTTTSSTVPSNQPSTFSPQIYTIELMEQPSASGGRGPHHQDEVLAEGDERVQRLQRRKTCFSIVAFVVAINVFIGIFRMLIGSRGHYGY